MYGRFDRPSCLNDGVFLNLLVISCELYDVGLGREFGEIFEFDEKPLVFLWSTKTSKNIVCLLSPLPSH